MDSYARTVVNLTVLGKIQDHERIAIHGGLFSIEHVSRGAFARMWNLVRRTFASQSRESTLLHLEFLVRDTERLVDEDIHARIPDARRGLRSLCRTYVDDIACTSTLEFLEKRLGDVSALSEGSSFALQRTGGKGSVGGEVQTFSPSRFRLPQRSSTPESIQSSRREGSRSPLSETSPSPPMRPVRAHYARR